MTFGGVFAPAAPLLDLMTFLVTFPPENPPRLYCCEFVPIPPAPSDRCHHRPAQTAHRCAPQRGGEQLSQQDGSEQQSGGKTAQSVCGFDRFHWTKNIMSTRVVDPRSIKRVLFHRVHVWDERTVTNEPAFFFQYGKRSKKHLASNGSPLTENMCWWSPHANAGNSPNIMNLAGIPLPSGFSLCFLNLKKKKLPVIDP